MNISYPFKEEVSLMVFKIVLSCFCKWRQLCPTDTEALFQKQTVKEVLNMAIAWVDLL